MGSSSLPKMLGVKRMPRPLSESRKPESRRKTAVLRGMRLRRIDSPPGFPGQPCARGAREGPAEREGEGRQATDRGRFGNENRLTGQPCGLEEGERRGLALSR